MMNFSALKGKITIIVLSTIMLVVILGCLIVYFNSFYNLKTNSKKYKMHSDILSQVKNESNNNIIPVNFTQEEIPQTEKNIIKAESKIDYKINDLQAQIYQLQTIMADKAVMHQPTFVIKDEFSKILFTTMLIEKKLLNGGGIKNDIIKLKSFSVNIKDILFTINTFEEVKDLKSKKNLLEEFNNYVRKFKSAELKQKGTLGKILSFASKYIAILDVNNSQDKIFLEVENFIKEGDFENAFLTISVLNKNYKDETNFMMDLEKSSKVQQGLNAIYFIIEMQLNNNNNNKI